MFAGLGAGMTWLDKLGKVTRPDFVPYIWETIRLRGRPALSLAEIQARLPLAEIERFREGFNIQEKVRPAKYLRYEEWLPKNLDRARRAHVFPAPPVRSILDLGCGPGWFLAVAAAMGHRVHGLDVPGEPVFDGLTRILGTPLTLHRIKPFEPLPAALQGFDLICAHMTCFNSYGKGAPWGVEEWAYFLRDLAPRLNEDGVIHLELNPATPNQRIQPELADWFRAIGARVIGERIQAAKDCLDQLG